MNVTDTLNDREQLYGDFDVLSDRVQLMKTMYRETPGWEKMTAAMREALEMDALKTCRLLWGDPFVRDSWLDKAGYAQLVVEHLDKEAARKRAPPEAVPEDPFAPKGPAYFFPRPVDLDELADHVRAENKKMYPTVPPVNEFA